MGKEKTGVTRVAPYNGNEDYIFISYSHRDMDTVLPILARMKQAGYRFWYDEGIDPGSEWPESIADHLSRCRVCLAFMSGTSLASQNCRREINFALSRNKDFLSVILEPVEMSPGMEMQISTYQSVLRYKYADEEQFLQRLLSVTLLAPCKEPEPAPEPAPAAEPSPTPAPPAPVREERPAPAKAAPAAGAKKWLPFALGGAALALAAVILAVVLSAGPKGTGKDGGDNPGASEPVDREDNDRDKDKDKDRDDSGTEPEESEPDETEPDGTEPDGTEPEDTGSGVGDDFVVVIGDQEYRNDTATHRIENAEVSAQQLRDLAKLDKCSNLSFSGCSLDGTALSELANLPELDILSFKDCTGIGDLSWLAGIGYFYNLTISGCGLTDQQAEVLGQVRIGSTLDLSYNELTSIPALADPASLEGLTISGNAVGSLEALSAFTSLSNLRAAGCGLTSLTGLERLEKLRVLVVGDNDLRDVEPIANLIYLTRLDLKDNDIASLAPLRYYTKLATVSLRGNAALTDLDILTGSAGTLNKLDLSGLQTLTDLSFLAGAESLTKLYVENTSLTSLDGLEDSLGLKSLLAKGSAITDISALKDHDKLSLVELTGNSVAALPELGTMCSGSSNPVLILSNNSLTGLENLPKIHYFRLMLEGNPLTDVTGLAGTDGTVLMLDIPEGLDLEPLREADFLTFYIQDLFIGQKAAMDAIHYNKAVTHEEAMEELDYLNDFWPDF